jgi:hypothetical protein
MGRNDMKPLPKTQAELLDALRSGVVLHYMPYMGTFNSTAYYFREDNHKRVTAAASALLKKGLAKRMARGRQTVMVATSGA